MSNIERAELAQEAVYYLTQAVTTLEALGMRDEAAAVLLAFEQVTTAAEEADRLAEGEKEAMYRALSLEYEEAAL